MPSRRPGPPQAPSDTPSDSAIPEAIELRRSRRVAPGSMVPFKRAPPPGAAGGRPRGADCAASPRRRAPDTDLTYNLTAANTGNQGLADTQLSAA